jgi:hypothetical protein
MEYVIEKPSNKLLAGTELDSDTGVGGVKRIRGKKLPLTVAGVHGLRAEYTRTIAPALALALAAEALKLERLPSAERGIRSAECPAEIDLMWKTAPPRMPISPPATAPQAHVQVMGQT